ncbi:MAG: hypothetical protein IMX00_07680 [Limnochordales bacterium]|nr:hypothetical protein [Limnochordales bacterium]
MLKTRRPVSQLVWLILAGAVAVGGGAAVGKKWLTNEASAVAGSASSAQSGTGDTTASQAGKVIGVAGVQTSEVGKVAVEVRWDGRTASRMVRRSSASR